MKNQKFYTMTQEELEKIKGGRNEALYYEYVGQLYFLQNPFCKNNFNFAPPSNNDKRRP